MNDAQNGKVGGQRKLPPMVTMRVYEKFKDLQKYMDIGIRKMPQWYKYGYGEDLRRCGIVCMKSLSRMSRSYERKVKIAQINLFLENWDVVFHILTLLNEEKVLSNRQMSVMIRLRGEVEDQLTGFRSWLANNQGDGEMPKERMEGQGL